MGSLLWIFCSVCLTQISVKSLEHKSADNADFREILEEERDNQGNILTQLIGDYDKVKTVSEGSDCQCKCVVRPLSRSACQRIEDGQARTEDFYTVETVTAGPECRKCICIAPPSALNPCEGDFRFKKLQEASRDDIKLSAIMDLLEGSLYGMDLLKLHSITTKLLERVDNMEKSYYGNSTKDKMSLKSERGQGKGSRYYQRQEKKKRLSSLQRNVDGPFTHSERKNEERFTGNPDPSEPVLKKRRPQSEVESHKPVKTKTSGMSIRTMTFYKANPKEDREEEEHAHETMNADGSVDLLIKEQLQKQELSAPATLPAPTLNLNTQNGEGTTKITITTTARTMQPTSASLTTPLNTTTNITAPLAEPKWLASGASPMKKSKLSWDEVTTQTSTTFPKAKGICKDTLASIADPVTHNTYGKNEGAWMKDPKGNGKVIYVTDYYYGNQLLEFRDMDTFKQGTFSNSYKLPYNWIGTGHVVYGGSFFYNRAFSRDIIRFDLRLRNVAAWTTLHDTILQEDERGHTDLDFGVDESGLWLVYPALDEEGFQPEVFILSKLRASDLQKEKSWRTGLRRNYYGNCFVICGVLYAVDSFQQTHANISYAFDTHTHTQMVPQLPFLNNYTYNTQIDYNPKERMLYAWDNGHQVTYDVIFAY
ncbi:hypothetical protein DNTS_004108 [Danionella cerebrum]|uniref:Olfactomedin-like domain-containing protein n=1 Tax=Danionella cerebrum TaxID=2873325 RepID=A0A553MUJ3_9TELE|nr:hypothetical protein DNTS_004108 [Danionella translucida]